MYYVLRYDKPIAEMLAQDPFGFPAYSSAKENADILHGITGRHYHVVQVESVWCTKTLADRHEERKTA